MFARRFPVITTVCALSSCDRAESEVDLVSVRDSAGVKIVETVTGGRSAGNAWHLVEPALLTLGGPESGDREGLFGAASASRLSDGRIVVANSGTSELKFYSPEGRFLDKAGRDGRGPGEFTGLAYVLGLPPDSLLVYDGRLSRISIFDERGRFGRTFRLDFDPLVIPAGVLASGDILALKATALTGLNDGLTVDSALVLRFDRAGELLDSLGRFAHNWRYTREREDGIRTTVGVPFAPSGQIVARDDGYCYGSGETYSIRCADARGVLQRIIRLEHELVLVTDQMVDQYFEDDSETQNPNYRRAVMRFASELPIPDHLPAFAAMLSDAEGNIWIEDYPKPGEEAEPSSRRVFSPDGRPLGSIEMPRRFTPFEIGTRPDDPDPAGGDSAGADAVAHRRDADYVLGRWRDRMDVECVRVYPLAKADAVGQACEAAT